MAPTTTRYACTSLVLARSAALHSILGEPPVFYSRLLALKGEKVLGWGRKWSGRRATALATKFSRKALLIEDGFVRSLGRDDQALSLVLDTTGIYYDSSIPSDLEQLAQEVLSESDISRARRLMAIWRSQRLSKYNAERDFSGDLPARYVLVCDQTFGDASIVYGGATNESFSQMLQAALAEYPDHDIILKTHPDVVTSGKKGYFELAALRANNRVQILADVSHPSRLIEHADAIYTVTSQIGFEALIWGKPVRCFGMPFYAGWGLTVDELPAPARRHPIQLEQLVHAALVRYPHYIDPVARTPCMAERTFAYLGLQRRKRTEFSQKITAYGFSRWKQPFIKSFLQGSDVTFATGPRKASAEHCSPTVALWGSTASPSVSTDKTILRIEDGFLRSSGLGADLVRPLSLVIDDVGIYFDASRPSRLELILETEKPDDRSIKRARALREKIVQLDVTKYNLGTHAWNRPGNRR